MKKVFCLTVLLAITTLLGAQQSKKFAQIKVVSFEKEISIIEKEIESIQDLGKLKTYFDAILTTDDYKNIKTREELQKALQDKGVVFSNTGAKFVFKEEALTELLQVIVNKYSNEGWELQTLSETKRDIILTFKK